MQKARYLSAITHKLGHALGFAEGYTKWGAATNDGTAVLNYDASNSVALLGNSSRNALSHLDCNAAAARFDLMCSAFTFDNPSTSGGNDGGNSDRRAVTELDLDILAGVYGYTVNKNALTTIGNRSTMPLPVPSTLVLLALGMVLAPVVARRRRLPSA